MGVRSEPTVSNGKLAWLLLSLSLEQAFNEELAEGAALLRQAGHVEAGQTLVDTIHHRRVSIIKIRALLAARGFTT